MRIFRTGTFVGAPGAWRFGAAGLIPLALLAAPAAQAQTPRAARADEDVTVSELVVTAAAAQTGAVVGDVVPELQLSPADIQAYGVSTMAELLEQLAPQTRTERGRGGAPVILLNGRRISGFNEIRDLPSEAILRVDILPEEAALKYGFTASQRVVNFVLRPQFRATTAELAGSAPTAGGRQGGQAEVGLFRIRDDRRLNLTLKVQGATALTEDERGLSGLVSGRTFDPVGNIRGTAADGQIDPALSALAGGTVSLAGVPASAATRAPTLADFAATAGRLNTSDVGRSNRAGLTKRPVQRGSEAVLMAPSTRSAVAGASICTAPLRALATASRGRSGRCRWKPPRFTSTLPSV